MLSCRVEQHEIQHHCIDTPVGFTSICILLEGWDPKGILIAFETLCIVLTSTHCLISIHWMRSTRCSKAPWLKISGPVAPSSYIKRVLAKDDTQRPDLIAVLLELFKLLGEEWHANSSKQYMTLNLSHLSVIQNAKYMQVSTTEVNMRAA